MMTGAVTYAKPHSDVDKPLLFISHKHVDADLAETIKNLVVSSTANGVRVFLSSDPGSEGPGIGKGLNDELQRALVESGVVVLVYTLAEYDWNYCMWECGVATKPREGATRVFVLQCGDDHPQTFANTVRVKATDPDDIERFVRALLTESGFFPNRGPVTDYSAESEEVSQRASQFYDDLAEQIKGSGPSREWSIWPVLTLELDHDAVSDIENAPIDKELEVARSSLTSGARIVDASPGAATIFGKRDLPDGTEMSSLVDTWTTQYSQLPDWIDTMAAQLVIGVKKRRSAPICWTPLREIGGVGRYFPGAGSLRVSPRGDQVRISYYFYSRPGAQSVTSAMTRVSKIERIDIDKEEPESILLTQVLESLEKGGWHRIPVLEKSHPRCVIHTAMIDSFMRRRGLLGDDLSSLTLHDLLADSGFQEHSSSTFAVVPKSAELVQAHSAMSALDGCRDVFVTESGTKDEPVVGWLTSGDLAEAAGDLASTAGDAPSPAGENQGESWLERLGRIGSLVEKITRDVRDSQNPAGS